MSPGDNNGTCPCLEKKKPFTSWLTIKAESRQGGDSGSMHPSLASGLYNLNTKMSNPQRTKSCWKIHFLGNSILSLSNTNELPRQEWCRYLSFSMVPSAPSMVLSTLLALQYLCNYFSSNCFLWKYRSSGSCRDEQRGPLHFSSSFPQWQYQGA